MPRVSSLTQSIIAQLDRVPPSPQLADSLLKSLNSISSFYGFERIETAFFEDRKVYAPLLNAGIFEERGVISGKFNGSEFLLRPSGALGVLRAYGAHQMTDFPPPLKFNFYGPVFFFSTTRSGEISSSARLGARLISGGAPALSSGRKEAAHAEERLSVLSEWGMVLVGEDSPVAEAETIFIVWKAFEDLGFGDMGLEVRINATGCEDCHPAFRSAFASYLRPRLSRLCKNCQADARKAPTKIFQCPEERCEMVASRAPQVLDFICEACKKHLKILLEFLEEFRIPYFLDNRFFRDGSWYHSFIFELALRPETLFPMGAEGVPEGMKSSSLYLEKASGEVLFMEGGRISRSAETLAGRKTDAVAVGVILDNLQYVLKRKKPRGVEDETPRVFLTQLGELAKRKSFAILEGLRAAGIGTLEALGRNSIKSQLKSAERRGTYLALIIGQKEALDGTVIVREVETGIQETMPQGKLIEFLKRKLKK